MVRNTFSRIVLAFMISTLAKLVNGQTNAPGSATKVTATGNTVYQPAAYAGGLSVNYIRTWVPRQPYSSDSLVRIETDVEKVNKSTQFFDGLGRPLQMVNWQSSPTKKDIVSASVYDDLGREQFKFLPYSDTGTYGGFKSDPFGDQSGFYNSTYISQQPAYKDEKMFYGKTVFETSPLNRVTKSFAQGSSWAGSEGGAERSVQMQYLINATKDSVRLWTISNNQLSYNSGDVATNIPSTASTYGTGQLFKNVTIDEKLDSVVEYKDKDGHVVLKKVQISSSPGSAHVGWLCTYYIYDDFGRLRFVVPPQAVVALLTNATWDVSTGSNTIINELCFRYEYDGKGRMTAKKVPGAGWVYMIYDQHDRLVFTQDANLKATNRWTYTLYDGLNRPIQTGFMTKNMRPDSLQMYVNDNTGSNSTTTLTISGDIVSSPPAGLLIDQREAGRKYYQATQAITVTGEFLSENDAEFVAQIVTGTANSASFTSVVLDNPIPSGTTGIPLAYNYYDDYIATTKTYSTTDNSKLGIGANPYGETLPSAASNHTRGIPTVTRIRVIETPSDLTKGKWMETASFYDDKGRVIQTNADNYKGGKDISTNRYDFLGKVICNYLWHSSPAGSDTTRIRTNYDYDHAERLLTVTKQLNDNDSTKRFVARNSYDAMGQLLRKRIGQKAMTDTAALDNQDFYYNIRGWLKGQNWNYGASSGPTTSQMNTSSSKWFAFDLSYDWGYGTNQYNGNIGGQRWVSAGDGAERSFGYGYDKANRLLFADFNQNFSGSWAKSSGSYGIDFTVKMGDGSDASTAYDANGNILAMRQMGLKLNASSVIDKLAYSYATNSNKLISVSDSLTTDQKLGDFTDGNTSGDDYAYDDNGNLLKDRNKSIGGSSTNGIYYNHLNLPDSILVTGKGYIKYIYDAAGNKLEKRVEESSPSTKSTATTYLNGFVYENNSLQFFGHEEGRIRLNHFVTLNNPTVYAYDYFLKDHLGNTRVVLTDEQQIDPYPAVTLEPNSIATDTLYYNVNTGNITLMTGVSGYSSATNHVYQNNNGNPPYNTNPNINTSANSDYMYKLNGASGDKTGLGIALKVMTGDNVAIYGKSYWHSSSPTNTGHDISISTLLTQLAASSAIANAGKGATAAALTGSSVTPNDVSNWLSGNAPSPGSKPKAYINWILFDEQFRVVNSSSGFSLVGNANEVTTHSGLSVSIAKNGYLYVYVSNESNQDVFFDNLQVIHTRGPLLEETSYSPFGLTMAGISSKAAGKLENKYKFGGKEIQHGEFSDGAGIEAYDFGARNYDQQVGRWWSNDPAADKLHGISPYNYALNNPIKFFDPDGKYPITINVRSFAPFATFGAGNWLGDNRGFSTDLNKTSRLRQETKYETTTQQYTSTGIGSLSVSMVNPASPGMPLVARSEARVEGGDDGKGNGKGSNFNTHLSGNDDAVIPGLDGTKLENLQSPDIDVHTNFSISTGFKDGKGNDLLGISGTISGDGFPAAEAFVADKKGNKVFLGVAQAKYGPNEGPFAALWGDRNDFMGNMSVVIAVNKDGVFQGVYNNQIVDGKLTSTFMSIADWNKTFEKQKTTKQ